MFDLPKKGSKKSHHRWHVTYTLTVWYEIICAVDIPQNEDVDRILFQDNKNALEELKNFYAVIMNLLKFIESKINH